jgi:8-oxo-dGTP pyrophosphatase MutT (NUDIX family)
MDTFIDRLSTALANPLPGREAQFIMAHPRRYHEVTVPDGAKLAAVLALFVPKDGEWQVVFIERVSNNERDKHKGQISFPGGKFEEGDQTTARTALREAQEEVGIVAEDVQLLGKLSEIYIPVSNFKVQPHVGFLPYQPSYQLQLEEVDDAFEVPFSHFLNPAIRKVATIPLGNNLSLPDTPYFDLNGKVLWGATAMMMSELIAAIET